ncbi:Belongs to the resistance-nodulation-cell division (RND) (TC 2.A.6) family [Vibrio sp. B1REV9]|uniref:efflux RND transporter permease subunit n=1 Tax=Vibrio sp. B1REV9 TaxID=2751179 RepID=UPI001AF5967F|nr:efflux RND transporter permease subunit [Vibrio sp. B1REV9]CAE6904822.1 Belongs to the resistance-nodulation-cell division (RND) (TC 2.A.6) family [Vibrio sp. B1REV9]
MNGILDILSHRKFAAKVLTILIISIGAWTAYNLPLAEKPRFDLGKGNIVTVYPGASAKDIESNITSKIEKELLSISGLKEFTSTSETGVSNISVVLDSNVSDPNAVYQDVRDALARVSDLPSGVTDAPTLSIKKSYSLDFMVVGISGDVGYKSLRAKAKDLELALRRVEGIGEVYTVDLRTPEFLIQIEPISLRRYGLTLDQVATLIAERNTLISGGRLETLKNNPELMTSAELDSLDELREMFISFSPTIQLKDVTGVIEDGFEKGEVYGSINGNKSILFDLRTNETADVISTSNAVKALLEKQQKLLGNEYKVEIGSDLSEDIQEKARIVKDNGLVGLGLVLITLALFLDRRIAFWVAVSIPLCIFGTLALLPAFGQILDVFTLSALILIVGIIVDDAVVVSDKIVALVEEGYPVETAVKEGVKSVFPAVMASILSTMIAFVPLLFLPGNSGKLVYVIPLTVIIALCFSFIDALFFIPAHLKGILNKQVQVQKKAVLNLRVFNRVIEYVIRRSKIALPVITVVILSLGLISYQSLSYLFFPTDGAYLIEVSAESNPELNLDDVWAETQKLEALIKSTAEVNYWYGEVSSPNSYWVISLTPPNRRTRTAEQIVEEWEEKASQITGLAQIEFDIDGGGPPVGRPVELRVVGGTDAGRENLANDLTAYIESLEGTSRVRRDLNAPAPQIQAELQHQWLKYYGISANKIGDIIKFAIDGQRVTRIFNGEEEVYFRVALEDDDKSLRELGNILVRSGNDELVPLSKLVRWKNADGEAQIKHFNGERVIRVSSGVDAAITDPVAVFTSVQDAFANKEYGGASIVATGQILETQEAQQGFIAAISVAFIGIALLLILLFDRLRETLIVLSVIPFGIAGALFILFIHHQVLSFFSIIGMIALIGIMVNNSLVLIWHFKEHEAECNDSNILAFVIRGTLSRVRPITLTTITTVAGLIPLAYGLGGYDNYMSPVALVVGWGCVISMIVTLTVIPSIYLWTYRQQQKRPKAVNADNLNEAWGLK